MLKHFVLAASLLLSSAAYGQGCTSPDEDRAEILSRHMKNVDYVLDGERAQKFARATGGESIAARITHIQLWKLPDGENYLVAFYIGGCRAGNFSLPSAQVESNLAMVKPRFQFYPFATSLGLRGS